MQEYSRISSFEAIYHRKCSFCRRKEFNSRQPKPMIENGRDDGVSAARSKSGCGTGILPFR